MTFKELTDEAFKAADRKLNLTSNSEARREFALAKTHLEDAQMRFTRGLAKVQDVFDPADLEK